MSLGASDLANHPVLERVVQGRVRDIGALSVKRMLPAIEQPHRRVGPFVFFDHFGPVEIPPGGGFDVRPHPHIALATVTYLFEGEILHRDSLGTEQVIRPGAVNWMLAGRGIVHSERVRDAVRASGQRMAGIQCWLALPSEHEEASPRFEHHPDTVIPQRAAKGAELRVLIGSAYGCTSPVSAMSPTFYVDAQLDAEGELELPEGYAERAAYVAEGSIECAGQRLVEGELAVFRAGASVTLRAARRSRVMLLGGAPLVGERYLWWNFVSSSQERLESAKRDWKEGRFPKVPGDEIEFIPLPE